MFTKRMIHAAILPAIAFAASAPSDAAEVHISNPGEGPDIYLSWSNPVADPVLNDDFTVSFTNEENPDIQIQTGNVVWNARSQLGSEPGNIGTISLNPNSQTADFDLTIQHGYAPGAANVGSIVLTAPNWTGHSNLAGGAITGNLTGTLTVVKDSAGAGGELNLTVSGDLAGTVTAPILSALTVFGNLSGDITATERADALTVDGNVASTTTVRIASIQPGTSRSQVLTFNMGGGPGELEFAGTLILESGLPVHRTVHIEGALTKTGIIDLNHQDVAGWLELTGGEGCVINGRAVKELGFVTLVASGDDPDFAGRVDFDTVEQGGIIRIHAGFLSGKINVYGDMDGTISTHSGNILSGARIFVEGDLSGGIGTDTAVGSTGDFPGTMIIGGNMTETGGIEIARDLSGDITIEGNVSSGAVVRVGRWITATGRIMIDGLCDGAIDVRKETQYLSLIRTRHLGANGVININESNPTPAVVSGTIHIGSIAPLAPDSEPVTCDGTLRISCDSASGEWTGSISIVGCHATSDPVDICIGVTNSGQIKIEQGNCEYQVTHACVSPHCGE